MKKILFLIILSLISCTKIENYIYPMKEWTIEYTIGTIEYSYTFKGDSTAYYEIKSVSGYNVLIVYPSKYKNNVVQVCKTKNQITVIVMKEKIYALVTQGILTKEQADAVWNVLYQSQQDDEEMLISLSECV